MTRALFTLLALFAVLPSGTRAFAGPPEGVSGRMVLDEVADALRRYRREKDEGQRVKLLVALAPTRDPRVAVALGEALANPSPGVRLSAGYALTRYYRGAFVTGGYKHQAAVGEDWWRANEADLRRRAKALP
jgi:hypothetical protein